MNARLICGDVIETLRTLDAGSVHCVITSPPFYGLRDYGTGRWEGGSVECDHKQPGTRAGSASTLRSDGREHTGTYDGERNLTVGFPFRDTCGKCGARRIDQQIGLEATPAAFVARLVEVFREVRRVLRDDGTLWCNMGDSYGNGAAGASAGGQGKTSQRQGRRNVDAQRRALGQSKQLLGIPWRTAFALQDDGWILRSDIIWDKRNPMPESVRDRPTKSHEHLFLFAKKSKYYYDAEAIREPHVANNGKGGGRQLAQARGEIREKRNVNGQPGGNGHNMYARDNPAGRNKRDVWRIASQAYKHAHFATFPIALVEPCILAGTSERGACSVCGAPWRRVVERGELVNPQANKPASRTRGDAKRHPLNRTDCQPIADAFYPQITTGWQPTCTCNASVVPCTVLDPFSGAATTGKAALKHRRRYIGIDLSEKYTAMAKRRLSQVQVELF